MTTTSHAISLPKGEAPNEDAFLLAPEQGLFAVADGLGMYPGGEVASAVVVEAAAAALNGPAPAVAFERKRWLAKASKAAAQALHRQGKERSLPTMSATLSLLLFPAPGQRATVHVGDSRVYLWRDGQLQQLTRDHSVAWEQFEAGAITKEALRTHPNQRLLTRTLTARQDFAIAELDEGETRPGDLYVLCSDGLSKALTDAEITGALTAGPLEAQAACERLIEAARGVDDDLTVLVVSLADG